MFVFGYILYQIFMIFLLVYLVFSSVKRTPFNQMINFIYIFKCQFSKYLLGA